MKYNDVISYILMGLLFVGIMIPLIALLIKSLKELKHLNETRTAKRLIPTSWFGNINLTHTLTKSL